MGSVLAQLVLRWAHVFPLIMIPGPGTYQAACLPVASPSLGWGFDSTSSHPPKKDGLEEEVEGVVHPLSQIFTPGPLGMCPQLTTARGSAFSY